MAKNQEGEGEGLAPEAARAWIAFQRRFAWVPEKVGPLLAAGHAPERLIKSLYVQEKRQLKEQPKEGQRRTALGGGGDRLDAEVARLESLGVRLFPRMQPGYPAALTPLDDAPGVLFVRGSPAALGRRCLAIVGARAATQSARLIARRLARDLAAHGVTIISGLARGIDAAAHAGALEGGGKTVAVMACGIEAIYPPEHRRLADEIVEAGGAILTEMPMGTPPRRALFPLRNRLISGLSAGVIVVEARCRSGSLITVRHALHQGREVFVVPGAVDGPFAAGTNQLLREGARPVLGAEDVLEDLGWGAEPRPGPESSGLGFHERVTGGERPAAQGLVINLLSEGPMSREALALRSRLAAGMLAEALLELELAEKVVEDRDGRLQLNWRQIQRSQAPELS